jgi:hypothetical protein
LIGGLIAAAGKPPIGLDKNLAADHAISNAASGCCVNETQE